MLRSFLSIVCVGVVSLASLGAIETNQAFQ